MDDVVLSNRLACKEYTRYKCAMIVVMVPVGCTYNCTWQANQAQTGGRTETISANNLEPSLLVAE